MTLLFCENRCQESHCLLKDINDIQYYSRQSLCMIYMNFVTADVQTRGLSECEFLKRRRFDRCSGKNKSIYWFVVTKLSSSYIKLYKVSYLIWTMPLYVFNNNNNNIY